MNPVIPGYSILEAIATGPMAAVYLAVAESRDQQVALKILSHHFTDAPDFTHQFLSQAQAIQRLNHPNIVHVYGAGKEQESCFIAMEYLPGGSLKSKFAEGLERSEALKIIYQIAQTLDYAHSHSCLHGVIRPESILFREDGSLVLTQFGIGEFLNRGLVDYGSPEQALAKPTDARSDLYSLGALLYEALTGKPLYEGDSPEEVAIKHISAAIPELPQGHTDLQEIFSKLVAKNPEHRYQNARQAAEALTPFLSTGTRRISEEAPTLKATRQRTKRSYSLFAMVALAALVPIFAVIVYSDRPHHLEERVSDLIQEPPPKPEPHTHLQIEVAGQLAEAQAAEKNGKLEDAYLHYKKILTIDPSNKDSLKGTRRVAGVYLDRAFSAVTQEKNIDKARSELEQALIIAPNHPYASEVQTRLSDLETDIQDQLEQEKIEQQGLEISQSFQAALKRNDLPEAENLLQQLESTVPEHQQLKSYQLALTKLSASLEKQKRELLAMASTNAIPEPAKIDSTEWLLNKAEIALNNDNLMLPKQASAYFYYSKILDQIPNQKQAIAGLESITKKYLQMAASSIDEGQFEMANTYLDRGAIIVSKHHLGNHLYQRVEQIRSEASPKNPAKK